VQDKYFHEAKRLGYRARSAFKLLEIEERYQIIKPGMKALDLASAPGSFLQVLCKKVGTEGFVVGVDIQKIVALGYPNVKTFQENVLEHDKIAACFATVGIEQFDLITSDIAPNTTGLTGVDQYRSIELNLSILEIGDRFLKKGGNTILKVFVGEDVDELVGPIKSRYAKLQRMKPKACRDRSFEEYFICLGKK
jgi:23S rRNA (uridine2552-2'-O)-methyltransferase